MISTTPSFNLGLLLDRTDADEQIAIDSFCGVDLPSIFFDWLPMTAFLELSRILRFAGVLPVF